MNILITGGEGFIGRYLTRHLQENHNVVSLSHKAVDICEPLDRQIPYGFDFDAVVHLAALLMIDGHSPEDYFRVNALGTYNVLEFCRKREIPNFIYTMTHSDSNMIVCGGLRVSLENRFFPWFGTTNFQEGKNSIPFIASKIAAMEMVLAYDRIGAFQGTVLRLANIRGYGSRDEKYNCVFHQFVGKAIKGEPIEIWGNPPKTIRDMIYIKDVCSAIEKALNPPPKSQRLPGRRVFNVGSGVGTTILEEAKAIIEAFGGKSEIVFRPDIKEVREVDCIFNIDQTKQELGWKPRYSYFEAMKDYKKEMERTQSDNAG